MTRYCYYVCCLLSTSSIVVTIEGFSLSTSFTTLSSATRTSTGCCYSKRDNDDDETTTITSFLDWLYDGDNPSCQGNRNSIAIQTATDGKRRGVYALQDFRQGTPLFQISLSSPAVMTIEQEETTDAQRGYKLMQLLQQPQWQSYQSMLPTRTQNWDPTPDVWTKSQIQQLEFPPYLIEQALERKDRIETLAASTSTNNYIPLEDLEFATWLVESRSLTLLKETPTGMPTNDEEADDEENVALETRSVMIPLVDMINHDSVNPNAELVIEKEDDADNDLTVVVMAQSDISAGQEVTISYGTGEESSVELLQYYGFVPSKNPWDLEMLELYICMQDEEEDDYDESEVDDEDEDEEYDDEEEEEEIEEDEEDIVYNQECLATLADSCWSTTLQEDEDRLDEILLQENNSDDNVAKTVLEYRIRMKRAMQELQEDLEFRLKRNNGGSVKRPT